MDPFVATHPFLGLFNLGPIGLPELLVIFALVLLVFGPRKLPEIAEAFGKSITKFKSASKNATAEVQKELDEARRAVESDDDTDPPKDGEDATDRDRERGDSAGP
ncbi:twin-arginine translocase TatA/TatE family subunit [bacterium]|nr:twin-arginine translocase TatA/TatE family subunit [bacterium]